MERREFIKTLLSRTAVGAGIATAGTAGLLAYAQPRREVYRPEIVKGSESLPLKLDRVKRAVVIGGGLAGISASLELAERGFEVTLVETSPSLGGKLTGWNVDVFGESFPVEHGFHGFFDQYYNLNEMFRSAGVGDVFTPAPGYPILFNGKPTEVFGQTSRIFPLNIISIVQQSRSLDIASFVKDYRGLGPVIEMFRYDYDRTFKELDSIDFMTYCRKGEILPAFVNTVLHPFSDATMNRMEVLSAAEALRYFHFYFMGSPEGLAFRITKKDCMTALINPLGERLKKLNVKVMTGRKVARLLAGGKGISAVELESTAVSGGSAGTLSVSSAEVPEKGWLTLHAADGMPVMLTRRAGQYLALDGRCTHMGCPVASDPEGEGFSCPCHAGRFDADGIPLSGPPKSPLARLQVNREGDHLVIGAAGGAVVAGTGGIDRLECDYCVVAADVRGTREIIRRSELQRPEFEKRVASLGEADPYAVLRLWLDRPLTSAAFPFYTVSGYAYTDSVSLFSSFQEPFISWAKKIGGSVVELHAYAIAPGDIRPEAEIRATMIKELHQLFPETRGAAILHDIFMMQSNFTRWAPGDHALRPGSETPFANLFFAGDWVKIDAPVFLMEAAAFSGRLAANAICGLESLRQRALPVVPKDGLFA